MSVKNAGILGIRMDSKLKQRVDKFYAETGVEGVTLARSALNAALDAYEQNGRLVLPLRITGAEAKALPLPVDLETHDVKFNPDEAAQLKKALASKHKKQGS